MVAHATDEMLWLEALADDVVEDEQDVAGPAVKDMVDDLEVIVVIQHVQVVDDILIGDVLAAETYHLVEDGKGVAQGTVGFLGDDVQRFRLGIDAFALGDISQVLGDIVHRNPLEVKNLATRKDGGDNLVLLRRGKDELGIRRWLFQCLQESVEGRCRQHVNLVDDVDFVLPDLRRDPYLVDQIADVIHGVVGCRVELVDVERGVVVEGTA